MSGRGSITDNDTDKLPNRTNREVLLVFILEAAGCDNAELLGHLRSGGTHFRGCWGLDAVLGRK